MTCHVAVSGNSLMRARMKAFPLSRGKRDMRHGFEGSGSARLSSRPRARARVYGARLAPADWHSSEAGWSARPDAEDTGGES